MEEYFKLLNDYFDRIFVVTIKSAKSRQVQIEKELQGLEFEFFYGADRNEVDIEDLIARGIYDRKKDIQNHRFHYPMTPGGLCCAYSHKLLYEEILRRNYDKVLIFEDDLLIVKEKFNLLPLILKELPGDWELLFLGYDRHERYSFNGWINKYFYHMLRIFGGINYSRKSIANLYPRKVSRHIYKAGWHFHTHAYAIKSSAVAKLIELQTPLQWNADHLLAYASTNELIRAYISAEKIFLQQSNIEGSGVESFIKRKKD